MPGAVGLSGGGGWTMSPTELTPTERLSVLLMPPGLKLPVNHDAAISMLAHRLRERETTARAAVASLERWITRTQAGDHMVWSLAPIVGVGAPLAVVVLPKEELLDEGCLDVVTTYREPDGCGSVVVVTYDPKSGDFFFEDPEAEAQAEHAAALDELPREAAEGLAPLGEWASGGAVPSPELLARVMRGLTR